MQIAAADRFSAQRQSAAATSQAQAAPIADLTQLAVAQTNAKATASAGAALANTSGELTGVLLNISA